MKELSNTFSQAKKKGIEALGDFVYTYESNYFIESISEKTLSKLLSGEFKSADGALHFDDKIQDIQTVKLLLLRVNNGNLPSTIIIESIFRDE